jgi:twitching motility protein PilT
MDPRIKELLELSVVNKASDLHLIVGMPIKMRVSGELIDVKSLEVKSEDDFGRLILSLLSETQKNILEREKEIDFSIELEKARFRSNIYFQKGKLGCALRIVPHEIPNMADLNLPEIMNSFVGMKQGFVLITGPTGQGKSTTVASVLNEINKKYAFHIETVEDPVEYLIDPIKSIISQRELGSDTNSFDMALRSCLRQDPNVVFVGEMRDLATISAALTIAETGHLVFSTLHTNSASQTIDRIIDIFPEGASKEQVRSQLASVLTAVVSQRLLPLRDGKGLVPAFEVLLSNSAVKNAIRESKTYVVDNVIQTNVDMGMMSLEMSLGKLIKNGLVDEQVALSHALRPSDLQSYLRNK